MATAKKLRVLLWFYRETGEVCLHPMLKMETACSSCWRAESFMHSWGWFCPLLGGTSHPGAPTKYAVDPASPWTRWCNALAECSEQRQLHSIERHIWKGQRSSMRIKQWKEENNPLRKLASIVCVGVHIKRKWGVFSQAVRILAEEIAPLKDSWRNEGLGSSSWIG